MSNSAESDSLEEIEREESEQQQEETRQKLTKTKKTVGKKSSTGGADGGKGKKRKKDKNAPKRGVSAYLYFASQTRNKVKEGNPGMSFSDITRAVSEQWKLLTDEEKRPFIELQEKDKLRYTQEKQAYEAKQLEQSNP
jgi:hypothetical protein